MDCKMYNAAIQGDFDFLSNNRDKFGQLTPNKNTLLHIAALNGQTECVNVILKECPALLDIHHVNDKDETPLHFAARGGHLAIVQALIKCVKEVHKDVEHGVQGAKQILTAVNKDKDTALHVGVQYCHLDVVKLLVNEDREFAYKPNICEESPLYIAAEKGLYEFVTHILDNCNSPSYEGPLGRNALHAAVIFNSQGITKKLLEKNRDLLGKRDEKGWAPIHYAAHLGHVHMVEQLLDVDKKLAYLTTEVTTKAKVTTEDDKKKPEDDKKKTALHIATIGGHIKVMEHLIITCPDCTELLTEKGENILHLAVMHKRKEVVDFILTRFTWTRYIYRRYIRKKFILTEMMVNSLINQKDEDGNTPLHLLALSNWTEIASDLIKKPRVETMVFNKENMTPLDIACRDKYLQNWPFDMSRKMKRHGQNGQRILASEAEDGEAIKKEVEDLRKLAKTHMIVAILIATITFAAGFTLPGAYDDGGHASEKDKVLNEQLNSTHGDSEKGMAVLAHEPYFQAFIISDTISMALSFCAIYVYFMASSIEDKRKLIKCYSIARTMVTFSAQAMVVAFLTGVYVVLQKTYYKVVMPIIGVFTFLCFLIAAKRIYNRSSDLN